jgi:hypothetical protein
MRSLDRPCAASSTILARNTSRYGDVYFLARVSNSRRSTDDSSIKYGLFLGISYHLRRGRRIANPEKTWTPCTSLYSRNVVLSGNISHAGPFLEVKRAVSARVNECLPFRYKMMKHKVTRCFVGVLSLSFGMLSATAMHAQGGPKSTRLLSTLPKTHYEAASVHASAGLHCRLYPAGSKPSSGVVVFTDADGYARFHAIRPASGDAVHQLTLDCTDSAGKASSYPVDLRSADTFAPRPLNLALEPGIDRPALKGDPLSYTQSQLIQAGYGLRPNPTDAAAYSRWLLAASKPGRLLEAKRPNKHSHTVTSTTSPWWVGSVLTGSPSYISIEAVFNVPTGIPGGDQTTSTEIAIWNGLGGFKSGSGLIQGGVNVQTTPTVASYSSWREYCCGNPNSNGYGGAFTPNPGDQIYSQEWYCDSAGNLNLIGGYGCTYLKDLTSGAILSCTSANGSPCWSVKALPLCSASPTTPNCTTLGTSAEFVIENQSPQVSPSSTAFTDFTPAVTVAGSAYSSTTNSYSKKISTDPAVYVLTDFTNTTTRISIVLGTTDQTFFGVSPTFKRFERIALYDNRFPDGFTVPPGAPMALALQKSGDLAAVVVGRDGVPYISWQQQGAPWHSFERIAPYDNRFPDGFTVPPGAPMALALQENGNVAAVVVGRDGVPYISWQQPGAPWSSFERIAAFDNRFPDGFTVPPEAPMMIGNLVVTVVGRDGVPYIAW